MKTKELKQLSLPFASEGHTSEQGRGLHHMVTASAIASVAILRAAGEGQRVIRGLNLEIALFAEAIPQEVLWDKWCAIEDLLMRLARNFSLSLAHGEAAQLVVHGVENLETDDQADLIDALKNPATFQVNLQGKTWSFVRWVEQKGRDFEIQFIDPIRIRAWIASHQGGRDLGRLLPFLLNR